MGTRYGAGIAALAITATITMSELGLAQTQEAPPAVAAFLATNQPTISVKSSSFQNWLTQPTMTGDWGWPAYPAGTRRDQSPRILYRQLRLQLFRREAHRWRLCRSVCVWCRTFDLWTSWPV